MAINYKVNWEPLSLWLSKWQPHVFEFINPGTPIDAIQ